MKAQLNIFDFLANPELIESWEGNESNNPNSEDESNDQNSEESPGNQEETNSEKAKPSPKPRKVRMTVTGTPKDVKEIILNLYSLEFAEVYEWSKPQPTGIPGEVISILYKRIYDIKN